MLSSIISSAIICWASSIRTRDLKTYKELIKMAGSALESLETMMQRLILHKISQIMGNPENPLHKTALEVFSVRGFFKVTVIQTDTGCPSWLLLLGSSTVLQKTLDNMSYNNSQSKYFEFDFNLDDENISTVVEFAQFVLRRLPYQNTEAFQLKGFH